MPDARLTLLLLSVCVVYPLSVAAILIEVQRIKATNAEPATMMREAAS